MSTLERAAFEGEARDAAAADAVPRLWERLLAQPVLGARAETALGTVCGFAADGRPLVAFATQGCGEGVPALSCVALDGTCLGRTAVVANTGGVGGLVILGLVHTPVAPVPAAHVRVDGERVVITGDKEIVLTCGEASITLTSAGKVLLQGAYVSSRSSGVNRIKGGSVEIN